MATVDGWESRRDLLSSLLENKPIADVVYGSEVDGTAWIVLQLVPDSHNVIVDGTGGTTAFIAVNLLQQLRRHRLWQPGGVRSRLAKNLIQRAIRKRHLMCACHGILFSGLGSFP